MGCDSGEWIDIAQIQGPMGLLSVRAVMNLGVP